MTNAPAAVVSDVERGVLRVRRRGDAGGVV